MNVHISSTFTHISHFSLTDTWKKPSMTTSLVKTLAAMSLDPQVDTIVNNTFRENHITVVKDLKQILKDKIRMANK